MLHVGGIGWSNFLKKKIVDTFLVVLDCYGIPNSKFPFDSFALSLGAGSQLRVPETSGGEMGLCFEWNCIVHKCIYTYIVVRCNLSGYGRGTTTV